MNKTLKRLKYIFLTVALTLTACHDDLWNDIDNLKSRVTDLETLCNQTNTNIASLQTIVDALRTNDMITNVSEVKEGDSVTGYTITFLSGKSITIHNGSNGQDGTTPVIVIGAKQDTDNVYYWTLNGQWLLKSNGAKTQVTDVTPKLQIQDGQWYISYDNGISYESTPVGKVPSALFSSIDNSNAGYVVFTLADGETQIKLVRYQEDGSVSITYNANGGTGKMAAEQVSVLKNPTVKKCVFSYTGMMFIGWNTESDGSGVFFEEGETITAKTDLTLYAQWKPTKSGTFSINADGGTCVFSMGNLQYQASENTWRFARNQYDLISLEENLNISATYDGWIDLFGWGTGKNPTQASTTASYYSTFNDWGNNVILDADGTSYSSGTWRTLTKDEWTYVIKSRYNASKDMLLSRNNVRIVVNDNGDYYLGRLLFPDKWTWPTGTHFNYGENISIAKWKALEAAGCIFLPYNKNSNTDIYCPRKGTTGSGDPNSAIYWTSTTYNSQKSYGTSFADTDCFAKDKYLGEHVRLVKVN